MFLCIGFVAARLKFAATKILKAASFAGIVILLHPQTQILSARAQEERLSPGQQTSAHANESPRPHSAVDGFSDWIKFGDIGSGIWTHQPSAFVSTYHDSNIFAVSELPNSDLVTIIDARWRSFSKVSRNTVSFEFDVHRMEYKDFESETRTDYFGSFSGDFSLGHDIELNVGVSHEHAHVARESPEALPGTIKPSRIKTTKLYSSLNRSKGRLYTALGIYYSRWDYKDVLSLQGYNLDQDHRDVDIWSLDGAAYYAVTQKWKAFVRGEANVRIPLSNKDRNPNSDGVRLYTGFELIDFYQLNGEIGLGYFRQDFEDDPAETVDGASYFADLKWNASPLIQLTLLARRGPSETSVSGTRARLDSYLEVGLNYTGFDNFQLSADFEVQRSDYDPLAREDLYLRFGGKLVYLVNEWLNIGAVFEHSNRDSSVNFYDFDRQKIGLFARANW